jgi:hypothetical protein
VGDAPDVSQSTPKAEVAGQNLAGEAVKALAQLETLPVQGRGPGTGYSRDEFDPAWADTDHNGCDTRNDILARDLTGETFKPGTDNCVVATGTLADKYTGTTISFVWGRDTSAAVQIDHIVPLSDAWQKGAQQLTAEQRRELATGPLNLMATGGPTNITKGDQDAATWLPPNKSFRCEYVSMQVAVKAKYKLWITKQSTMLWTGYSQAASSDRKKCRTKLWSGQQPHIRFSGIDLHALGDGRDRGGKDRQQTTRRIRTPVRCWERGRPRVLAVHSALDSSADSTGRH